MSLHIDALTVQRGQQTVLDALGLPPLQPGSLTALVGPNGAGKSTLIAALAGLLPARGQVQLQGRDLLTLPVRQRSRLVALLPQRLPAGSILSPYELLLGGLLANGVSQRDAIERIDHVLAWLGLEPLAMRTLGTLSGGQRQMIALAQVLSRQASLLLLDEPTSALDLRWQLTVLRAVADDVRQHGRIGLIALHDLNLALRSCDRVIVLQQGRVIADGRPDLVLAPELLQRVYGIDARLERCSRGQPMLIVD